jgi:hypothetical protein
MVKPLPYTLENYYWHIYTRLYIGKAEKESKESKKLEYIF